MRYLITLDRDTRLPRGVARALLGIAVHPLNRARYDPAEGRVTEGYGILQPRVSVTFESAAGSLFARLYAGHTGVDPYTTAVSDTYQDLFGEGIFTGKGLIDVDAFRAALGERVPENALLSHDLFEGLHARTALVSDLELVDDYPASVLAHARRLHRWVRGDWQILGWLLPWVRTRTGFGRNRLPLISRFKIFDNLRRSLLAPAYLAWFAASLTLFPEPASAWCAAALAVLAFPTLLTLVGVLQGSGEEPLGVFVRTRLEALRTNLAQALVRLTFLAYHASEMVHAIVLTLSRLVLTQRRLLEWETAASVASFASGLRGLQGVRTLFVEMIASPVAALVIALLVLALRPHNFAAALPFLLLWAAAPAFAYVLSRPVPPTEIAELDDDERQAPAAHRAQELGLLRPLRDGRGQLAAARQLPGAAGADAGAPHLAHQHRDGARSRRSPRATSATSAWRTWSRASRRRSPPSTGSSATRGTCSTGTTPARSSRSCPATCRPSTAETSRACWSRSPRG